WLAARRGRGLGAGGQRAGGPGGQGLTRLEEVAEGPEVEVEVVVLQPEQLLELLHALLQAQERGAQPLDLLVAERAALDASHGLALHELTQQLHQRQHQLRQPPLDTFGIRVHAARQPSIQTLDLLGHLVEGFGARQHAVDGVLAHAPLLASRGSSPKEYAGHGPVHSTSRSRRCAATRSTRARNSPTAWRGTR